MLYLVWVSTKHGQKKDTRADRFCIVKTTTLKLKFSTLCRHTNGCFVWVLNLVADIEGGKEAEGV